MEIKKGLLVSVSLKKLKIGEYLAKLQAKTCLSRALCALVNTSLKDEKKCTRHNHLLLVTLSNIHQ